MPCGIMPPGALVLDLWLSVLCMRSKAWLAARVSLRLARLPRTASSAQRSRRLRSMRAAALVLLPHAEVTENMDFFSGSKTWVPRWYHISGSMHLHRARQARPHCWDTNTCLVFGVRTLVAVYHTVFSGFAWFSARSQRGCCTNTRGCCWWHACSDWCWCTLPHACLRVLICDGGHP